MSLEAAKKLLTEVNPEEFAGKSKEEIEAFLKDNGYDCTPDEVKKACILAASLSEEEMEKVAGGKKANNGNGCPHAAKKETQGELGNASGHGDCGADYYKQRCSATVEKGSWCWSNDWCQMVDTIYTIKCSSSTCSSTTSGSSGGGSGYCFQIA